MLCAMVTATGHVAGVPLVVQNTFSTDGLHGPREYKRLPEISIALCLAVSNSTMCDLFDCAVYGTLAQFSTDAREKG